MRNVTQSTCVCTTHYSNKASRPSGCYLTQAKQMVVRCSVLRLAGYLLLTSPCSYLISYFVEEALIVDLAPLLGVEVGLVEKDTSVLAMMDLIHKLLVVPQGNYCGLAGLEHWVWGMGVADWNRVLPPSDIITLGTRLP